MNSIEQACKKFNLKLTPQRKVIAEVLSNSKDHPSVEELFLRVKMLDPKISMATVYRTLGMMEGFGIIKKLEIGCGKARYEKANACEHYHLFNLDNGKIIEFQDKKLQELTTKIAKELGFELVRYNLELYGTPIKKK